MASGIERRLTAILSADAVGYSRLMAADEEETLRTLTAYREQLAVLVRQHRGRVVDAPGDNLLAEFPSALDAARCALEIQRVVGARNDPLPAERRMEFRIGIHLGDVMVEGERIYGDGVNIAARLEGLAEPGGVCISGTVHEQVRHKLEVATVDLGDQTVKNIPDPIRVYRVEPRGQPEGSERASTSPDERRRRLLRLLVATAAVLVFLGLGLWVSWPRPLGLLIDVAGVSGLPIDPSLPDKPSIVVLPFTNMSADPEQEYFSDGMTEELTNALAQHSELFVISRSSAFTYKGKPIQVEDVGRELGVRYVLEGSVRKAGERIRVTAQLIDAITGFHLWSEQYDRELAAVFDVQSEIAKEIGTALQIEVRNTELGRAVSARTDDLRAYDAHLKGMSHFERFTRDDLVEARRHYQRALELDPSFGPARALLGNTYVVEYVMGWNRDPRLLERGQTLAREALEHDPTSFFAYIVLANVHNARGEFEEALASADKAIELNPNFDVPHGIRGLALVGQGRPLLAMQSMRRALRLNPKPGHSVMAGLLGAVNYGAGHTERAVEHWEQSRSANPDMIIPRIGLTAHYESVGRHQEARTLVQEILRVNPNLTAEVANSMFLRRDEWPKLLRRAGLP